MAHYIPIELEPFEKFLTVQGFSIVPTKDEIVYEKPYTDNPNIKIKVYTSFQNGAIIARDVGRDAIRLVAVLKNSNSDKSYPIFKGSRVYRTTSQESVHNRVQERIDAATKRCQEWIIERSKKMETISVVGKHVGTIGEEIHLLVTVIGRKTWMDKFLFTLFDNDNNRFIYWTNKDLLEMDETYSIRCKVKAHTIFCAVRQTEITEVFGKRVVK